MFEDPGRLGFQAPEDAHARSDAVAAEEGLRERDVERVAHDLRGPLTNVLLWADLLKGRIAKDGDASEREMIERIVRNAQHMTAMVTELVELTRFESHEPVLRRGPCDLAVLVTNAVSRLDRARADRVDISIEDGSYRANADAVRIERATAALLDSAFDRSEPTSRVGIRLHRRRHEAVVDVEDHGRDMTPAEIATVFQRRFGSPGARDTGGLGLSLYIARLVVEAHGGRVSVRSEMGRGSSLSFALPLAATT